MTKLPEGWKEVEIGDILEYQQPAKYIVSSEEYNDAYKTPVLTAGKSFILGYTDEKEGIYSKLPVIIFDDFTTASKFVTFPFKVKSSAMKLLTAKSKEVNLKYIFLVMQNIKVSSVSHKRYYLSKYQHIKIPLPPLETQRQIVSILEKAEALKQARASANELTQEYLKSVFAEMFLKNKQSLEKIGNVVLKVENKNPEKYFQDKYFDYVDIASIDNKLKKIISTNKMLGKDAPSRARQLIKNKDILVSTVRPNLNAIAMVPKYLDNQICSTGFCVLRANIEKIKPEYLFFIGQTDYFVNLLTNICKGASYPAVSDKDIFSIEVPLPSLELQNKFSKVVEQVEHTKEQQEKSGKEIDDLYNALMQKAFTGELVK